MHDRSEMVLVAGLLLRRMNELAQRVSQNEKLLEKNRNEAKSLHKQWSELMEELRELDKKSS